MANMRGLVCGLLGQELSAVWLQLVTLVASTIVFLTVAVLVRKPARTDALLIAITVSAVVSYYCSFTT